MIRRLWYAIVSIGMVVGVMAGCLAQKSPPMTPAYSASFQIVIDDEPDEFFAVANLDWSPDDSMIAIGGHSDTYVYTLSSPEVRYLRDEPGASNIVVWDSESKRLAGSARNLWLWDVQSDQILTSLNNPHYEFFSGAIWDLDQNTVISTYSDLLNHSEILLWDVATNTLSTLLIEAVPEPGLVTMSPDGETLVIATHDTPLMIVDRDTGTIERVLALYDGTGRGPAVWSHDGSKLVTGGKEGSLIVWDTSTWQVLRTLKGHESGVRDIVWHPQDTHVASAAEDGVRIWNVTTGQVLVVQYEWASAIDWNQAGDQLVTAIQNELYIWDITRLP